MLKKEILLWICLLGSTFILSGQGRPGVWGDQGNGTYINPILNADYSDPDVIRVGDTYYMVASDFHFMGMQVLESADMVNWKLISRIYQRLDFPGWDENARYAGGAHGHPLSAITTECSGCSSARREKDCLCLPLRILRDPGLPCIWSGLWKSGKILVLSGTTTERPIWVEASTARDLLSCIK